LEKYVRRHRLSSVIRLHLGVSQDDAVALRRIVETEFGGQPLDAVIDDASNKYAETLASFECLFPLARAGGAYIIEDWGWGHHKGWPADAWADRPLLSPLITELMLVLAMREGFIDRIEINDFYTVIWRGTASLGPDFRVKDSYKSRGFALPP
jgi:hypothetical protein